MSDGSVKTQDHPFCFGYPTTYTEGHSLCSACNYSAECKVSAEQMAERLREELGVNAVIKRRKDVEKQASALTKRIETVKTKVEKPKVIPTGSFNSGNKKADAALETWVRRDLKVKEALIERRNPFISPAWAKVATDALLSNGKLRKADLKKLLQSELGWGEGAASSHVSIFSAALGALEVASITSNEIELN